MRRLIAITFLLILAGAAYQARHWFFGGEDTAAKPAAAVPVVVATVQEELWLPSIRATGSLRALQGVNVTAQESGMVTAIYFDSGRTVSKGELLLQQYDVDEQFTLKSLRAQLSLAQKNYDRNQSLKGNQVVSQSQLDTALSDLDRLTAQVESLEASLAKLVHLTW